MNNAQYSYLWAMTIFSTGKVPVFQGMPSQEVWIGIADHADDNLEHHRDAFGYGPADEELECWRASNLNEALEGYQVLHPKTPATLQEDLLAATYVWVLASSVCFWKKELWSPVFKELEQSLPLPLGALEILQQKRQDPAWQMWWENSLRLPDWQRQAFDTWLDQTYLQAVLPKGGSKTKVHL